MRKSKKFCVGVVIISIIVIMSIGTSIYFFKINDYKSMLNFPVGYAANNELIISENAYKITGVDFDNERYYFKGVDKNIPYHIVTSKCKALAVLNDFVIYPSIDDPNGLIFTSQDNFLNVELKYYSEDIIPPDCNKNTIRQLLIVFSPIEYPSSGYTHSINKSEIIDLILNCIKSNKDPTEILIKETDMRSDTYSIWIDYSDFPMYERIFSTEMITNSNNYLSSDY